LVADGMSGRRHDPNDETLSGVNARICILLQAKCSVIAEDIGVAPGSVIIQASEALRRH